MDSTQDKTIIDIDEEIDEEVNKEIIEEDLFEEEDEEEYNEFIYKHLDFLNAFHTYYRRHNKLVDKKNMFEGMDDYGSGTNMISECLYNHLNKYNEIFKHNPSDLELLNPNDYETNNDYTELFGLLINGELKFVSYSLISIIMYITDQENWKELNWYVMDIKI
jgi:hypothetical protein